MYTNSQIVINTVGEYLGATVWLKCG